LLTDQTTKTIAGLTDVFGNAVGNQNIDLYTNTIFGVHTFGDNNNPQLFSDANIQSGGVLLSAGDITWIHSVCNIPEPAAVTLAALALGALVNLRKQRGATAGRQRSCSVR